MVLCLYVPPGRTSTHSKYPRTLKEKEDIKKAHSVLREKNSVIFFIGGRVRKNLTQDSLKNGHSLQQVTLVYFLLIEKVF